MPTAPAHLAASQTRSNPLQTAGMLVLLPYLFLIYSRASEMGLYWLHPTGVMAAVLIILIPASGQALKAVTDRRIGRYLTLFTLWGLAIVPFSVWRGGAFRQATMFWPHSWLDFLAIACMIGSMRDLRRTFYTIGFGVIAFAVYCKIGGNISAGRLELRNGLFGNPNDMAMVLLAGVPFLIYMLMEGGLAIRAVALAGMFPIVWALIRTGSRAGFIGFGIVVVFLFFRCSIIGKLAVAAGSIGVLAAGLLVLPHSTLARYITFFHAGSSDVQLEATNNPDEMNDPGIEASAAASANERYQLLIDSIKMTFRHPITGVGMENFPVARNEESKAQGIHTFWYESHNAYTQLSSETGLVGFLFYMAAFVGSFRVMSELKRFANAEIHPQSQTISRAVFCLQTSLVGYSVTSFFAPVAYKQIFPTLAGLTLALMYAVQPQFEEWRKQRQAAAAPPPSLPASVPARQRETAAAGALAVRVVSRA